MPGTKEIKRRISSVKNTKKITKAMELVAASKMKRAVNSTMASRLYAEYSTEVLQSIASSLKESPNVFFNQQEKGKTLLVLITSNRGLCGGYNAQVIKKVLLKLKELEGGVDVDIITVGRKGDVAMRRINQNIVSVFLDIPDVNLSLTDVFPLSKNIIDGYKDETYSKVYVAYTDFKSALVQVPVIKKLLPISKDEISEVIENETTTLTQSKTEYLFEGDFETLLESFAHKITRMQIYQMILESNASEQSARMLAMKNATDASGEMIDELTLVFNKARQANITRE
ncbi:MAG: ATP synthase F1 subunit gamma, partial [Patescibacteria group bacterium]